MLDVREFILKKHYLLTTVLKADFSCSAGGRIFVPWKL